MEQDELLPALWFREPEGAFGRPRGRSVGVMERPGRVGGPRGSRAPGPNGGPPGSMGLSSILGGRMEG